MPNKLQKLIIIQDYSKWLSGF